MDSSRSTAFYTRNYPLRREILNLNPWLIFHKFSLASPFGKIFAVFGFIPYSCPLCHIHHSDVMLFYYFMFIMSYFFIISFP